MNSFECISYFPDGSIYEQESWEIEVLQNSCPSILQAKILLDSKKRSKEISSPIGTLEFIWTGSTCFGASTIRREGITVNSGLYLPGIDIEEEGQLLSFFINEWRKSPVVKELCKEEIPFAEVETITARPLACTINWATISKELYDHIAYYDLQIGASYFHKLFSEISN